jgi:hypothetical protein
MTKTWLLVRIAIVVGAVVATGGVTILANKVFLHDCLAGVDLLPTDCWPLILDYGLIWPSMITDPPPVSSETMEMIDELPLQREEPLMGFLTRILTW